MKIDKSQEPRTKVIISEWNDIPNPNKYHDTFRIGWIDFEKTYKKNTRKRNPYNCDPWIGSGCPAADHWEFGWDAAAEHYGLTMID